MAKTNETLATLLVGSSRFTVEATRLARCSEWFASALKSNTWREGDSKTLRLDDEKPVVVALVAQWLNGHGCWYEVDATTGDWATKEVDCETCSKTYHEVSVELLLELYFFAHRREVPELKRQVLWYMACATCAADSPMLSLESIWQVYDRLPADATLCDFAVAERLFHAEAHSEPDIDDFPNAFTAKVCREAFLAVIKNRRVGFSDTEVGYQLYEIKNAGTYGLTMHECEEAGTGSD